GGGRPIERTRFLGRGDRHLDRGNRGLGRGRRLLEGRRFLEGRLRGDGRLRGGLDRGLGLGSHPHHARQLGLRDLRGKDLTVLAVIDTAVRFVPMAGKRVPVVAPRIPDVARGVPGGCGLLAGRDVAFTYGRRLFRHGGETSEVGVRKEVQLTKTRSRERSPAGGTMEDLEFQEERRRDDAWNFNKLAVLAVVTLGV